MGASVKLEDATKHAVAHIPPERGAEWALHRFGKGHALAGAGRAVGEAVEAYVNHGRWIVECPDCASALLACHTDARFLCYECGNIANGGHWRPVAFPRKADVIDQLLMARPEKNRNWRPGETLKQLRAENTVMGL